MEGMDKITKAHRSESFGPGDILASTVADFLSEDRCRDWIMKKLHRHGAFCPGCSTQISGDASLRSFWSGGRVRCRRCRKYFTALTGTFIAGSHLSFARIIILGLLIGTHAQDEQIASVLHMSTEGIRLWKRRFDGAWRLQRALPQSSSTTPLSAMGPGGSIVGIGDPAGTPLSSSRTCKSGGGLATTGMGKEESRGAAKGGAGFCMAVVDGMDDEGLHRLESLESTTGYVDRGLS